MQKYDIAMKIALSSDFYHLPLPGTGKGKYREFEIKKIGATLRPDGLIETDERIYVLEYAKRVSAGEAMEAAIKAHLVAMETGRPAWAVLVAMEGEPGKIAEGYHSIYRTPTRCDVDVIVINDSFMDEVGRKYGVSVDEMRSVEFWKFDRRAVDLIAGAGRIICLWLDEECRIAMARRGKSEKIEGWKALYLITEFLNMSYVLEREEMEEILEEVIRRSGGIESAFDVIERAYGSERAYEIALRRLGPERAYELAIRHLGPERAYEFALKRLGPERAYELAIRHLGPERAYEFAMRYLGEERALELLVKRLGKKRALELIEKISE